MSDLQAGLTGGAISLPFAAVWLALPTYGIFFTAFFIAFGVLAGIGILGWIPKE